MSLIQTAKKLYDNDSFAVDMVQTVYALDTTIGLCLSVFLWARFRQAKAAVKMHTLLDLCGNIPTFIHITDFTRWYALQLTHAFFVIRGKTNLLFRSVYSRSVDKFTGRHYVKLLRSNQPKQVWLTLNPYAASSSRMPNPTRTWCF